MLPFLYKLIRTKLNDYHGWSEPETRIFCCVACSKDPCTSKVVLHELIQDRILRNGRFLPEDKKCESQVFVQVKRWIWQGLYYGPLNFQRKNCTCTGWCHNGVGARDQSVEGAGNQILSNSKLRAQGWVTKKEDALFITWFHWTNNMTSVEKQLFSR